MSAERVKRGHRSMKVLGLIVMVVVGMMLKEFFRRWGTPGHRDKHRFPKR